MDAIIIPAGGPMARPGEYEWHCQHGNYSFQTARICGPVATNQQAADFWARECKVGAERIAAGNTPAGYIPHPRRPGRYFKT